MRNNETGRNIPPYFDKQFIFYSKNFFLKINHGFFSLKAFYRTMFFNRDFSQMQFFVNRLCFIVDCIYEETFDMENNKEYEHILIVSALKLLLSEN